MSLINCEISLILACSENSVIIIKAARDADPDVNHAEAAVESNECSINIYKK